MHYDTISSFCYLIFLESEDAETMLKAFDTLGANRLLGETLEAYVRELASCIFTLEFVVNSALVDMRKHQHMIDSEIYEIMALYEVSYSSALS